MQRKNSETSEPSKGQYQKFKEAARELETDDSEEAFDRALRKVAKSPPPKHSAKETGGR